MKKIVFLLSLVICTNTFSISIPFFNVLYKNKYFLAIGSLIGISLILWKIKKPQKATPRTDISKTLNTVETNLSKTTASKVSVTSSSTNEINEDQSPTDEEIIAEISSLHEPEVLIEKDDFNKIENIIKLASALGYSGKKFNLQETYNFLGLSAKTEYRLLQFSSGVYSVNHPDEKLLKQFRKVNAFRVKLDKNDEKKIKAIKHACANLQYRLIEGPKIHENKIQLYFRKSHLPSVCIQQ